MADVFGTLTSRGEVEQAALRTLRTWIVTYLAKVERDEGLQPRTLPPPGAEPPAGGVSYPDGTGAFRGGIDFETWQGELLPLLIVLAEPVGDAERVDGAGAYLQHYGVQVAAVVEDPNGDEAVARQLADRYGKALMGLVSQQGNLSGLSTSTDLVRAPHVEWVDPANRRFVRTVVEFQVLVGPIVTSALGPNKTASNPPGSPPSDPYGAPADYPTVSKVDITLGAGMGTQSSDTVLPVTQ